MRELITIPSPELTDGEAEAMLPDTEALARLCENLDITHHQETAEPVSAPPLLHGFDTLLEARLDSSDEALEAKPLKRALRQVARDYNHHQPQPILGDHTPIQALGKWYAESPDCFVAHLQRLSASTLEQTQHARTEAHDTPPPRSLDTQSSRTSPSGNGQTLDPLQLARTLNRNTVASSLIRLRQQPPLGSLLVTSCNEGAGKTTVALQLAYAGVQEVGLRILLIDANPTHPHLATLFETDEAPGLCELFAGQAGVDEVIRPTETPGLDLVTLGLQQRDMLVRQDPQRLRARLDALRGAGAERYDLLLIDGPSSLGEQDLTIGATAFDGVVLVIESERTRWEVMQYTQDRLQSAGARLLGAVLNKRKYYIPRGLYA
ncbi:cobyric acid synthase CobQ [Marichromatium purpuratum 984]|uniref:Cobyric acid synthase CobQ n=1 Tax=Marichromatium purpuratum 984 TaxID=765910 RepID=W0E0P9_MARPU|nr:cobyric acid synthase CobQ [Marichromatium purpuratum 984]